MFTRTAIISIIMAGLVCLVMTASGVIQDGGTEGVLVGEVQEPNYVKGELLVRFAKKPDGTIPNKQERNTILASFGVQEKGAYTLVPGLTIVNLPEGMTVEEAIVSLEKISEILYAEPNYILKALFTPNDPKFDEQWGLHNTGQTGGTYNADINAPEAWDLSMGTREIVVAVIDSGVDYYHTDLVPNMWVNTGEIPGNGIDDDENGYVDDIYGYDFCTFGDKQQDSDPMDDAGHGTHCAGIASAVTNNNTGVAGVCPNVRIMALKFLHKVGKGERLKMQYPAYSTPFIWAPTL